MWLTLQKRHFACRNFSQTDSLLRVTVGLRPEQNSGVRTMIAGGCGRNERFASLEHSFVSCRSHLQWRTKKAQGTPVPLRAIKTVSCTAIITDKDFLFRDVLLHDAGMAGGIILWTMEEEAGAEHGGTLNARRNVRPKSVRRLMALNDVVLPSLNVASTNPASAMSRTWRSACRP
jgi:hypothetical protein